VDILICFIDGYANMSLRQRNSRAKLQEDSGDEEELALMAALNESVQTAARSSNGSSSSNSKGKHVAFSIHSSTWPG